MRIESTSHYLQNIYDETSVLIALPLSVSGQLNRHAFIDFSLTKLEEHIRDAIVQNTLATRHELFTTTIASKLSHSLVQLYGSQTSNSIYENATFKILEWLHHFKQALGIHQRLCFYGAPTTHEKIVLNLLETLGFEVILISDAELTTQFTSTIPLPLVTLKQFERHLIKTRDYKTHSHPTTAYAAEEEIETILYCEETGLFKPWQLSDYIHQPLTLFTTFEELVLLWKEPARMRPGFQVKNKHVTIPRLFAKISGVHQDLGEYCQTIMSLLTTPHTVIFSRIPICQGDFPEPIKQLASEAVHHRDQLDHWLLNQPAYPYKHLRKSLQLRIVEACQSFDDLEKSIQVSFTLHPSLIRMINEFDAPHKVPKVVIYDSDEFLFSEFDKVLIQLLEFLGFDLLIITPTGYNNIEEIVDEALFVHHRLSHHHYDLKLEDLNTLSTQKTTKSFFSNWFNRKP